jgi:hypothetical protein
MAVPKVVNKTRKPRTGHYCTTVPNRKKPRYYVPCDVARIARYCLQDNPDVSPIQLLAVVAKGIGFTKVAVENSVKTRVPTIVGEQAKEEAAAHEPGSLIKNIEKIRDIVNKILLLFGIEG